MTLDKDAQSRIQWLIDVISSGPYPLFFNGETANRLEANAWARRIFGFVDGTHPPLPTELVEEEILKALHNASDDSVAFVGARLIAARYLKSGIPMPTPLAKFATDYLLGKVKKPKPRPASMPANSPRNMFIYLWVGDLLKRGCPTKEAAYQEVASALLRLELRPNSAKTIKEISLAYGRILYPTKTGKGQVGAKPSDGLKAMLKYK